MRDRHFTIVDEKAEKRTDYDAMGANVLQVAKL